MNQRSITAIAGFLARRPIGRIVSVLPLSADDYIVSIEDRRDGREHVLTSCDDLEAWLESFKRGECLKPSKGFCDCVTSSTPTTTPTASSSTSESAAEPN